MAEKTSTWGNKYGLFLAAAIAAGIMLLPLPSGLTPEGQKALAVFVALITLWATEPLPLPIISLLMVPVAVFTQLITVPKALAEFSTSSIFLITGAFLMAPAMSKCGLAERFIYWLMTKIGHTTTRITLGITFANIILAFMVPSSSARTAILLPICMGLIEVFRKATGIEGYNKFSVNLLLTLALTNATISAGILTATIPNPLTVDFIHKASGKLISYQDWFVYGFPPALLMTFVTWWFIGRVFKPEIQELPGGLDFVHEKLRAMGKVNANEWKTGLTFGGVVLLWMTGSLTGLNTTIVALMGVCALFALRQLTWADANKTVAFQFMLTLGGGFLVANLLISTKAADWAAHLLFSAMNLNGASILVVLLAVMLMVQYLHIPFMGTTKMTTMVMPIVLGIAATAKIDPAIIAMPAGMIIGGYPLFLFYNTIPNLIVYGTGELRMSDFPKVGFALCTFACFVYVLCASTYWKWLGLY